MLSAVGRPLVPQFSVLAICESPMSIAGGRSTSQSLILCMQARARTEASTASGPKSFWSKYFSYLGQETVMLLPAVIHKRNRTFIQHAPGNNVHADPPNACNTTRLHAVVPGPPGYRLPRVPAHVHQTNSKNLVFKSSYFSRRSTPSKQLTCEYLDAGMPGMKSGAIC